MFNRQKQNKYIVLIVGRREGLQGKVKSGRLEGAGDSIVTDSLDELVEREASKDCAPLVLSPCYKVLTPEEAVFLPKIQRDSPLVYRHSI